MKLNSKGFSLVELMVVVAIIGILASIGLPSVTKYMAKSRQSEAKTNLGSLYTAEKAFATEYTLFHTNFQAIGFAPEGRLRYNIGFGAAGTNAGTANGFNTTLANPNAFNTLAYCGTVSTSCTMLQGADGQPAPAVAAAATTAAGANGPTFRAEAHSSLVSGMVDIWSIDQVKSLDNPQSGI